MDQRSDPASEFLTVLELATWLRTPEATLRYWRHIGEGPTSIRVGRRVLYRQRDVDGWLDAQAARTGRGSEGEAG